MTFSFLRSIVQSKKKSYWTTYWFSFTVSAGLLATVVLPPTGFLFNLQVTILLIEFIMSFFGFVAGAFVKEVVSSRIAKNDFSALIDSVNLYNFREKNGSIADIYSFVTIAGTTLCFIYAGWIWQSILYLLFTVLGRSYLLDFVSNLPKFVSDLNLKEEDFV